MEGSKMKEAIMKYFGITETKLSNITSGSYRLIDGKLVQVKS